MITTILNIKGGCSKTLTAEMLARGYAKEGRKTLVVDADGQGDITASLMPNINFDQPENLAGSDTVGVHSKSPEKGTIVDYLKGITKIEDCIWHTGIENIDLIPSSMDLFTVVYEMQGKGGADFLLGNALKGLDYDEIIIDNNPSINKMTYNSIYAADVIICPTNISEKTLKGVMNTRSVCVQALDALPFSKPLNFKIVLTMMTRNNNCKEGARQLREAFGKDVFDTQIRFQQKPVQDAEFSKKSLLDMKAGVAEDYRNLTKEVIQKDEVHA